MGILVRRLQVYPRQQWVMIRAEDPGALISGVFVQPIYSGLVYCTCAIAYQDVVQDQAWQGMKGVPPRRRGRRNTEGEPGLPQEPPGWLIPSSPQIEVGS
jgi:hypothetical protein